MPAPWWKPASEKPEVETIAYDMLLKVWKTGKARHTRTCNREPGHTPPIAVRGHFFTSGKALFSALLSC